MDARVWWSWLTTIDGHWTVALNFGPLFTHVSHLFCGLHQTTLSVEQCTIDLRPRITCTVKLAQNTIKYKMNIPLFLLLLLLLFVIEKLLSVVFM